MYLGLILSLNIASCYSYVAYQMFQGFDVIPANITSTDTTTVITTHPVRLLETLGTHSSVPVTPQSPPSNKEEPTTPVPPVTSSKFQCPEEEQPSNIGPYEVPAQRDIVLLVRKTLTRMFNAYHEKALYFLKDIKESQCPEEEQPSNIGPYEVRAQRDIVLVRKILTRMFNAYHDKALYFLKDIKEATKATAGIEKRCHGFGTDRTSYRKCVRQVSIKCEIITKGLVTSLERQRLGVEAFTNGTVCSVKGMKADPIELIKTLAMEEASLEFALPGFLRLLSACSIYCDKMEPQQRPKKPLRHMTDQDLVVKHFLTKKSYIQLLKGSK